MTTLFVKNNRSAIIFFIAFCVITGITIQPLSATEIAGSKAYIHSNDMQLLDGDNNEIKLNGMNLGGWMLWEGWIMGGGFNSESKITERMQKVMSKDSFNSFRSAYYKDFISKKDIERIADIGFNCVRVPINYKVFFDINDTDFENCTDFELVDSLISWCNAVNIYVIFDLHALPGGQNNLFICDPDRIKLWNDPIKKTKSVNIWYQIAKRYSQSKIIAGYDLINEPDAPKGNDLVNLYKRIIDTIRIADKNHLLIIEGNNYARDFTCFNNLLDNNQIFSFHYYTWFKSNKSKIETL